MNYTISCFSFGLLKTDKPQRNIMHTAAQTLPLNTVQMTYFFDQGDNNTSVSIKSLLRITGFKLLISSITSCPGLLLIN